MNMFFVPGFRLIWHRLLRRTLHRPQLYRAYCMIVTYIHNANKQISGIFGMSNVNNTISAESQNPLNLAHRLKSLLTR